MTVSTMSATQVARFTRICEDQGITITRTKKGLFIRFPNGESTVQHFTNSDHRAEQNQIARFRRAGMTHPNDPRPPKDLPGYITEGGSVSNRVKQKITSFLAENGYPEAVFSPRICKDKDLEPSTVNRALYHMGFRPGEPKGPKKPRPWYTPDSLLEKAPSKPIPTPADVAEIVNGPKKDLLDVAVENTADATDDYKNPGKTIGEAADPEWLEENTVVPASQAEAVEQIIDREPVEHIDFIDERESWTVDPEAFFGAGLWAMIKDRMTLLEVVGIEWEVRTWRKK